MKKTFTIKEIRKYLEGNLFRDGIGEKCKDINFALDVAIGELEDKEDGIVAVLEREQYYIKKHPLDKYVGCGCCRLPNGRTCRIEKVDNKRRKLLINDIGYGRYWVTTKAFYEKWKWWGHGTEEEKRRNSAAASSPS